MTDEETSHHHTLADLPPERRREIASRGGKASTGGFRAMTPERRRELSAKGGRAQRRQRRAKEEAS